MAALVIAIAVGAALYGAYVVLWQLNPCVSPGRHGPLFNASNAAPYPLGTGDDWEFRVLRIEAPAPYGCYRVFAFASATGNMQPEFGGVDMSPQAYLLGTPASFHVNVTDVDRDGRLSEGDSIVLGNLEPGRTYGVILRWKDDGGETGRLVVAL